MKYRYTMADSKVSNKLSYETNPGVISSNSSFFLPCYSREVYDVIKKLK